MSARWSATSSTAPPGTFSIATFAGDRTDVEVPFTSNKEAVIDAIEGWTGYGTTGLHDAVAWMPDISLDSQNPKRFAVLITDGVDNASNIPPEKAREIVRLAQLPTYVIGLDSGSPFELKEDGKKVYRYADVLNLLVVSTGGRYSRSAAPMTSSRPSRSSRRTSGTSTCSASPPATAPPASAASGST